MSPPAVISIGCRERERVYAALGSCETLKLRSFASLRRAQDDNIFRQRKILYMARRRNSPTKYREPVMQIMSDEAAFANAVSSACVESGMTVK